MGPLWASVASLGPLRLAGFIIIIIAPYGNIESDQGLIWNL